MKTLNHLMLWYVQDFLEQIRAAAANRANEEIVFGDDAGSSDGE